MTDDDEILAAGRRRMDAARAHAAALEFERAQAEAEEILASAPDKIADLRRQLEGPQT